MTTEEQEQWKLGS